MWKHCQNSRSFYDSGAAPVVFTQGSTAVHNSRDFYTLSSIASKRLGLRAVLLGKSRSSEPDQDNTVTLPYMPSRRFFPTPASISIKADQVRWRSAEGLPMPVVPYRWDQPDNAARLERLGVGLHIPRHEYTVTPRLRRFRHYCGIADFRTAALKSGLGFRQRRALLLRATRFNRFWLCRIMLKIANSSISNKPHVVARRRKPFAEWPEATWTRDAPRVTSGPRASSAFGHPRRAPARCSRQRASPGRGTRIIRRGA